MNKRIAIHFLLLATIGLTTTPAPGQQNLAGHSLAHSNYRGRDLRGADLTDADLGMADFSGADLRGANLTRAKLDRINLNGADLRGVIGWREVDLGLGIHAQNARFSGADLRESKVAGTYSGGYFEGADFSNSDLTRATLHGRFHGANFDGAIVHEALMLGAAGIENLHDDLRRRGAIVSGEDFAAAVRSGRDFSREMLANAPLQECDLQDAKLAETNLHSAKLDRARLDRADLRDARAYYASAKEAQFQNADLSHAHFDSIDAPGASFIGARLVRTSLRRADLAGADFSSADLTGADLSYADLSGTDLTGATLDDVLVDAAIIRDLHGVPPEVERKLRGKAARWKQNLSQGFGQFLSLGSLPLHMLLTPLGVVLGLHGFRFAAPSRSYAVFTGMNCVAVVPWACCRIFSLLGGSPTAQMSAGWLWSAWFALFLPMLLGLLALFIASLLIGGFHIVKYAIRRPRQQPLLALSCAFVTAMNCFFAIGTLVQHAPDA